MDWKKIVLKIFYSWAVLKILGLSDLRSDSHLRNPKYEERPFERSLKVPIWNFSSKASSFVWSANFGVLHAGPSD